MKKKAEDKRFNKKTKFKKKQLLRDRWFPELGYGIVVEVLRTRIKVNFGGNCVTVDSAHYQFLKNA